MLVVLKYQYNQFKLKITTFRSGLVEIVSIRMMMKTSGVFTADIGKLQPKICRFFVPNK